MATNRSFLTRLMNIKISDQYLALQAKCNGDVRITNNDKTIIWEGVLQPTPISREYKVVVEYTLEKSPTCVVKSPDLSGLAGERQIPHTYKNETETEGTQLCLYLPQVRHKNRISEWQPTMFLADTIIPWASTWLLYFEFWLFSGQWDGGGVEHDEEGPLCH